MTSNQLYIRNFGPIQEANININSLTVLSGDKREDIEFILQLINTLNHLTNESHPKFNKSRLSYLSAKIIKSTTDKDFLNDFTKRFNEYIKRKPEMGFEAFEIPIEEFDILYKAGIANLINLLISQSISIKNEGESNLSYKNLSLSNETGKLEIEHLPYIDLDLEKENQKVLSIKFKEDCLQLNISHNYIRNILNGKMDYEFCFVFFYSNFARSVLDKLFEDSNTYFMEDLEEDFITFILDNNIKSPFHEIASKLENDILNKDEIEENERQFYHDKSEDNYAYESQKKLRNIIFYLKHIVNTGDYLILDHIEDFLDMESIELLIEYLITICNNGLNVILATDSYFLIKKLNERNNDKIIINYLE